MKSQILAVSALALLSACGHSMGFASPCASDLLDHNYIPVGSNRGRSKSAAETYCTNSKPDQIAAAKQLMDEKYTTSFPDALKLIKDYNEPQLACAKQEFVTEKRTELVVTPACQRAILASVEASADDSGTVFGVLKTDGHFSKYLAMVEAAGMSDTLRGGGPWTVFAPTDEAVAAHQTEYDNMMARDFQIKELIPKTLVVGLHPSSELKPSKKSSKHSGWNDTNNQWKTAAGSNLTLISRDGAIRVNGRANVVKADMPGGSNGLIYSLDDFAY